MAKIKHPSRWRCDVCGKNIQQPEDGMITWREDGGRSANFMIVHHEHFKFTGNRSALNLDIACGKYNMIGIGLFLETKNVWPENLKIVAPRVKEMPELIRTVNRLINPGFEESIINHEYPIATVIPWHLILGQDYAEVA